MNKNSILLLGGYENGDYEWLQEAAEHRKAANGWSCTKDTRRGDEIWFYIASPISSIVAIGEALKDAQRGEHWPYETRIGNIRWIENPITLNEISAAFPDWGWPRYARGKVYLDSDKSKWLRRRMPQRARSEEAGRVEREIWIFGHGDKSAKGFEKDKSIQEYIDKIFSDEYRGRYRYSKKRDAQIVILSRGGVAFGHFEISGTELPKKKDIEEYPPVRHGYVYLVKANCPYPNPVYLHRDLSIKVHRPGIQITESQFDEIKRLAGPFVTHYDPPAPDSQRKKVLREITDRQGQGEFRSKLLAAYGTHCAITDCDAENALEAAHIDPYVNEESHDSGNGLLLRSDIHTLFDLKLLAINPVTFKVALASPLLKTSYKNLQGQLVRLPAESKNHPDLDALKRRWQFFNDPKQE